MPVESPIPASPWRRWLRPAIAVPIVASLAVHAAMLAGFVQIRLSDPAPRRLTDAPAAETLLVLTPPSPAQPPPPPPAPSPPTPEPEPPARTSVAVVEPPRETARVAIQTDIPIEKPVPPPRPAPTVTTPAPPPPPPAPTEAVFAGMKSDRAGRIVYALDASGAMTTSLRFVKEELARSVARLDATQSFQVVVFRQPPGAAEPIAEFFDGVARLAPATEEAKSRLGAWLETIQPSGRSEPLAGLRAALGLSPDLVFLLTRSIRRSGPDATWGNGPGATLAELDRLNPRDGSGSRPTVIKALQFLDPDPTGLLPAIANTHGDGPGSYRVVKLEEVK